MVNKKRKTGFRTCHPSFQHPVKGDSSERRAGHGRADVPLEDVSVCAQVFCGFFVERVGGVWLEEEKLVELDIYTCISVWCKGV